MVVYSWDISMEYFYSSGLLERFGSYENIMVGYDDGI